MLARERERDNRPGWKRVRLRESALLDAPLKFMPGANPGGRDLLLLIAA